MTTPSTPPDLHVAITEFLQGLPIEDTLEKFHITRETFDTLVDTRTPELKRKVAREFKYRRQELAVQMYTDGAPLWAIELETRIHPVTLYTMLHERGAHLRQNRPDR